MPGFIARCAVIPTPMKLFSGEREAPSLVVPKSRRTRLAAASSRPMCFLSKSLEESMRPAASRAPKAAGPASMLTGALSEIAPKGSCGCASGCGTCSPTSAAAGDNEADCPMVAGATASTGTLAAAKKSATAGTAAAGGDSVERGANGSAAVATRGGGGGASAAIGSAGFRGVRAEGGPSGLISTLGIARLRTGMAKGSGSADVLKKGSPTPAPLSKATATPSLDCALCMLTFPALSLPAPLLSPVAVCDGCAVVAPKADCPNGSAGICADTGAAGDAPKALLSLTPSGASA
mmetsp:Transcript_2973/g.9098  ORF Transcript_2973/g.9098 Transcript_2973/m.9098 type:complete len:292 (-) Transcript_2973:775-1650(-)